MCAPSEIAQIVSKASYNGFKQSAEAGEPVHENCENYKVKVTDLAQFCAPFNLAKTWYLKPYWGQT